MNRALDLITSNGAKTLHLGDSYYLRENNPASFIVIDAKNDFDALRNRAQVIMSVRKAMLFFKNSPLHFAVKFSAGILQ